MRSESESNSESDRLSAEVKEIALRWGASLVGIVSAEAIDSFPSHWVGYTIKQYTKKTSDILPEAKSVVVVGYHLWDDILEVALRKGSDWVYPGYLSLPIITRNVEQFLQSKGYKVSSRAGSLSYKRLAQLAGFGNFGKNALVVNPKYGPWIRLGAVLTSAELTADKPFMQDLCGDCNRCIEACPAKALTPYKVDDSKCLVGIHLSQVDLTGHEDLIERFEPSLTDGSHLMCMECQKVCRYGREEHSMKGLMTR